MRSPTSPKRSATSLHPTHCSIRKPISNTSLGDYTAAKEDFQRLNRLRNRSLESLIGLARVAVKENNLGLANEYVDEAVALYPANSEAYLRRASVRHHGQQQRGCRRHDTCHRCRQKQRKSRIGDCRHGQQGLQCRYIGSEQRHHASPRRRHLLLPARHDSPGSLSLCRSNHRLQHHNREKPL